MMLGIGTIGRIGWHTTTVVGRLQQEELEISTILYDLQDVLNELEDQAK